MSLRPDEVSDDPLHAANEIIRLESERDSLRSQLEEARAQLSVAASRDRDWVAMRSDLKAARDRIGALETCLKRLVDHVSGCIDCTEAAETGGCIACEAMNTLADAPERKTYQARIVWEEMKPEPRVDPFDMPGKGGGNHG